MRPFPTAEEEGHFAVHFILDSYFRHNRSTDIDIELYLTALLNAVSITDLKSRYIVVTLFSYEMMHDFQVEYRFNDLILMRIHLYLVGITIPTVRFILNKLKFIKRLYPTGAGILLYISLLAANGRSTVSALPQPLYEHR